MKLYTLTLLLVILASCSPRTQSKDRSEKNGLDTPTSMTEQIPVQSSSMIFARYQEDHLSSSEINSILKKVFRCKAPGANGEREDICSLQSPQIPTATREKNSPIPWSLKKNPKAFVWSQQLEPDSQFTLELQDSSGLPIPAEVTMQNYAGQAIATVVPLETLTNNQKFYLVGKIQGKNNSTKTMLRELTIKN